jgi:hypothetical protein
VRRQQQRQEVVDGVVRQLARSRPIKIATVFQVALRHVGGLVALAHALGETFVETMQHGTDRERSRTMLAVFDLMTRAAADKDFDWGVGQSAADEGAQVLESALADRSAFASCFANRYGERWVLIIDRKTRDGELRGDETGWEPLKVCDGHVAGELIFAPEEQLWLEACFAALP